MNKVKEESKIAAPIGIALDRFIKQNQDQYPSATGEFSQLLRDIALSGKVVNREISKAGLINIGGGLGTQNAAGDHQQKLDVLANIRFSRALTRGGEVCAIVSEEDEEVIEVNLNSKYVVAIDPLDGSSNIDVNVSIGTIFSIYERKSPLGSKITKKDYLQKGREQVLAGYLLYGSSTMLVISSGNGVFGFTYEPSLGEYFLSHPDMKIPPKGVIYSVNEGAYNSFPSYIQKYVNLCRELEFSGRYIGSLVADFHRNLLKGGIYMYPPTAKSPNGKLRLMYECNPLAFIIEQAGGLASDGENRILDIQPAGIHDQVPFFVGSEYMVQKVESLYAK
jgi:fructose-1,6-bisphosphatase I